jgi:zinc ribbon protein
MCPNCGTQVRADADFCPNCGQALRNQPAAPSPGGQVQPPAGSSPQFRFDINRLNTVDRVIAGASLVVFISLFLPWFTASAIGFSASGSESGLTAHGYLYIALIVAIALIGYLAAYAGLSALRLPIAHAPLLLVGTGLQLLFVLIGFIDKPSGEGIANIGWGFGAFIGLLAALVACGIIAVPAIRSAQAGRR